MRKISTIFLLLLFLLNLSGYSILFSYLQQQSDVRTELNLDNESYNEHDLITVTVPLSMPYIIEQPHFERISGEIVANGIVYKYVKRKITNNNLVLMCLPDYNKTILKNEKSDLAKNNTGLSNSSKSKNQNSKSIVFKKVITDYNESCIPCLQGINESEVVRTFFTSDIIINSLAVSTPSQPPEIVA